MRYNISTIPFFFSFFFFFFKQTKSLLRVFQLSKQNLTNERNSKIFENRKSLDYPMDSGLGLIEEISPWRNKRVYRIRLFTKPEQSLSSSSPSSSWNVSFHRNLHATRKEFSPSRLFCRRCVRHSRVSVIKFPIGPGEAGRPDQLCKTQI